MISVEGNAVRLHGTEEELMLELVALISGLVDEKILTKGQVRGCVRMGFMSQEQLDAMATLISDFEKEFEEGDYSAN